jgi:hypothetical protein
MLGSTVSPCSNVGKQPIRVRSTAGYLKQRIMPQLQAAEISWSMQKGSWYTVNKTKEVTTESAVLQI